MSPGARHKPAPPAEDRVQGRLERITFHNPENGYTVAKARLDGQSGLITLVGPMPGAAEGRRFVARGRKVVHPKFGPQLEVSQCRLSEPEDALGVRRYLASGLIKGVGPVLAGRIVDTLGPQALKIISREPSALAKVPGIGAKKAAAVAAALAEQGALREVMVFLQGHGVGTGTALRIFRRYGAESLTVLKTQPHRLAAEVSGIGFATADSIAARLGIAPDDPGRLAAGLLYALGRAAQEGHVFLTYDLLLEQASGLLKCDQAALKEPFARLHLERRITLDQLEDQKIVYLAWLFALERQAAQDLARIAGGPGLLPAARAAKAAAWVAEQLQVRPSPGQSAALKKLLVSALAVLTGGPGTGKTTLVRALVTIARRLGAQVALCAPTGRAAKRLAESCDQPAATIHRLLEFSPKENRFGRHASRPLGAELVVVDEASMIDVGLMAALAAAVPPGARLMLVGDADQLPSVGPGLVFRQVIASRAVSVARLREIFRQAEASLIVANAHRINQGRMPRLPGPQEQADFFMLRRDDPTQAAQEACRLATQEIPRRLGLDPMSQVQVLSPMRRGAAGCERLNSLLRSALNPRAPEGASLAKGDKVMQVRNNYDLEVFNGDLGVVSEIGGEGCTVSFAERPVAYSRVEMEDLALAYAVTVHKSQGSEYPAVVLCLANEQFVLLNRQLLYTAVTRGQRLVGVVGSLVALRRAVSHSQPAQRYSLLDRRLRQAREGVA